MVLDTLPTFDTQHTGRLTARQVRVCSAERRVDLHRIHQRMDYRADGFRATISQNPPL